MTGHGTEVEQEVRRIASVLGLPDFVYTVPLVSTGSRGATREVGDGLLIANGRGAVIQVKSREPELSAKGESWLARNAKKARDQGNGSRRRIALAQQDGMPLTAIPVRVANLTPEQQAAAKLVLDHDVSNWPTIVVFDNDSLDGLEAPDDITFWITLQDWRNLLAKVRSVTWVLEYVHRVVHSKVTTPLGREQERFLAIDAPSVEDDLGAQLFRELVERVWPAADALPGVAIGDYRQVVEFLDSVPPEAMSGIGEWVLGKRNSLEHRRQWQSGTIKVGGTVLLFACDFLANHSDTDAFTRELGLLSMARSNEFEEQLGRFVPVLAVGQLLAENDYIDNLYVFVRESQEVPPEIITWVHGRYGPLTLPAAG